MLGFDPIAMRKLPQEEQILMAAAIQRASRMHQDDMENLADSITGKIVAAWNRGAQRNQSK